MLKEDLIKFIKDNYKAGENLLWQTLSKDDVDEDIPQNKWDNFVDYSERYSVIADAMSERAYYEYEDLDSKGELDDEEDEE